MGSEVVKRAECGCCGMWEECTSAYIGWVKERFGGVWVCGLCEEAIKDEEARLGVQHQDTKTIAPPPQVAHFILQLIRRIISSSSSQRRRTM